MKKLLCAIALAMFIGGPRIVNAEVTYVGKLVDDTVISVDSNYDLDLNKANIDSLSFTTVYSSATMSASGNATFTSGRPSTASITVADYTKLIPTKATATIEVQSASTVTLRGQYVTLSGIKFQAGPGGNWTAVLTATGNAVALAAAINADGNFDAVAVSTVVYATATIAGSFANNWVITTNSTTSFRINGGTISGVNFIGGTDRARLGIQGVTFDITDANAVTSNAVTSKNISDRIMSNATLVALFTSTWNAAGVITSTSNLSGTNAYTLFSSVPAYLKINGSATVGSSTFLNGSGTTIDSVANSITLANHKYKTGEGVWLSTGGITPPTNLAQGTSYYVIRTDGNTIKLATTKALAVAGTAIDISTVAAQGTYTLNLIGLTGSPSFKWQFGNDGTNFVDLAVSSVTFTAAGASGWDLGAANYRYLRLKYTAPTFGGIDIQAVGNGKR